MGSQCSLLPARSPESTPSHMQHECGGPGSSWLLRPAWRWGGSITAPGWGHPGCPACGGRLPGAALWDPPPGCCVHSTPRAEARRPGRQQSCDCRARGRPGSGLVPPAVCGVTCAGAATGLSWPGCHLPGARRAPAGTEASPFCSHVPACSPRPRDGCPPLGSAILGPRGSASYTRPMSQRLPTASRRFREPVNQRPALLPRRGPGRAPAPQRRGVPQGRAGRPGAPSAIPPPPGWPGPSAQAALRLPWKAPACPGAHRGFPFMGGWSWHPPGHGGCY